MKVRVWSAVCIKKHQGMKDEERRWPKGNLNRTEKNCKNCKKAGCPTYRSKKVDGGFHCDPYDQQWIIMGFWWIFSFYTP